MAYKWCGHFDNEGKNYVITTPDTPRHWYNYLYNDEYITFTSQVGFGEGSSDTCLNM
jgi:cellobiose phosphorylase